MNPFAHFPGFKFDYKETDLENLKELGHPRIWILRRKGAERAWYHFHRHPHRVNPRACSLTGVREMRVSESYGPGVRNLWPQVVACARACAKGAPPETRKAIQKWIEMLVLGGYYSDGEKP